MSASVGELAVQLSANTQPMVQDMKRAEGALSSFMVAGEKVGDSMMKLTAQGAAFGLGMLGIHGIMESFKHGYELAEQNEKAAVSFKVLLGSAEAAKDMLQEVRSFAGSSGMKFGDARSGAAGLLRMGFDREDIRPMLKILGDVGATSFEGMEASMQKNIQMLGVIKDQGFLTAKNMKVLAMEGIEPWEALSKSMGKSKTELKAMLEAGNIDSATGISAILTAMQDKFSGGIQENAKTLTFQLEKMKSTTAGIFADIAGIAIEMSGAEHWLPEVNSALGNFRKNLASGKIKEDLISMLASIGGPEAQASVMEGYRAERAAALKVAEAHAEIVKQDKIRIDQMKLSREIQDNKLFGTNQQKDFQGKQEEQIKNFGKTPAEIEMEKMLAQAPDSTAAMFIKYNADKLKSLEDDKKMMEEGKRVTEQYRTEDEKLADETEKLNKLYQAGAISWGTYLAAVDKMTPAFQEFIKETKSLQDEIAKLQKGEEAFKLDSMKAMGANAAQLQKVEALMKERDLLKETKSLQDEAQKAIESQIAPAQKLADEFERAKKEYLAGNLTDQQFEALVNKYGADYMSKMGKDDPKFAGAVEAGSRESYSSMVAASAGTMSSKDIAQKQLDQAVIAAENLKAIKEAAGTTAKSIDDLKNAGAFLQVRSLGGG